MKTLFYTSRLTALVAMLASLLLTACGGGGGSSTASTSSSGSTTSTTTGATITSANQDVVAQEAVSSALGVLSDSSTITGADVFDERVLFAQAEQIRNDLSAWKAKAPAAVLVGASSTSTTACDNASTSSGTVTLTSNSAVSSKITAGDGLTMTFTNCRFTAGGSVYNGTLGFVFNSYSETSTYVYNYGMTMTYGNYTAVSPSGLSSVSANGSTTISLTSTAQYAATMSITTPSMTTSATYNGATRSRTLANYSANQTRSSNAPTSSYKNTFTTGGTVTSSALSTTSVTYSTPTAFVRNSDSLYPHTGVLLTTGSKGTLKLTTLSNTQVKVELDADGDGVYESNKTVAWSSLL